jgi:putative endonuclease
VARVDRQALGRAAEDAAAALLEARGLTLVLRNYRCRLGELDIVARESPDLLILAEVRLRSRLEYGDGAASVDAHKRSRLILAARHLLMTRPQLARLRIRFDVLDVRPAAAGHEIRWIRDAFRT